MSTEDAGDLSLIENSPYYASLLGAALGWAGAMDGVIENIMGHKGLAGDIVQFAKESAPQLTDVAIGALIGFLVWVALFISVAPLFLAKGLSWTDFKERPWLYATAGGAAVSMSVFAVCMLLWAVGVEWDGMDLWVGRAALAFFIFAMLAPKEATS